jgi:hypothetical protein
MFKRCISALLTANVFQNGLSRHEESWRLYTHLLQQLSSESINAWVQWYISQLDYDLAFSLWDLYPLGGTSDCREACQTMQNLVQICAIDERIVEDSGCYRLNFYDSIRLACAMDHNLDAIVTWEPRQFILHDQELDELQENGYFDLCLESCLAEDEAIAHHSIRIFSVSAFFLHLQHLRQEPFWEDKHLGRFSLEKLKIDTNDEGNEARATVAVRNPKNEILHVTAQCSTPCGALYRAIDTCVDQFVVLPRRRLIRMTIPETLIEGIDAPIEVRISVECDHHIFRASASNPNLLWALGNAYMDALNEICSSLKQV